MDDAGPRGESHPDAKLLELGNEFDWLYAANPCRRQAEWRLHRSAHIFRQASSGQGRPDLPDSYSYFRRRPAHGAGHILGSIGHDRCHPDSRVVHSLGDGAAEAAKVARCRKLFDTVPQLRLLARNWVPYGYIHFFAETLAGLLMLAGALGGSR